ncbi:MAG: regulatory domain of in-like proprotein convertase [Burkholderiales bacterium]|jgi:hypothetical protein|nr:regulatory domain of in-like proprotein convertase [Burkholderiales bacterium]
MPSKAVGALNYEVALFIKRYLLTITAYLAYNSIFINIFIERKIMKNIFFNIFFIIFTTLGLIGSTSAMTSAAPAPDPIWARQWGGDGSSFPRISTSGTDNLVISLFTKIPGTDHYGYFIGKFDFSKSYDYQWSDFEHVSWEGFKNVPEKIITDNAGNSYILGYSWQGSRLKDYFIVKYNQSGVWQWARKFGLPSSKMTPWGIEIDKDNNIYITCSVTDERDRFQYAYLAKHNSSGDLIWGKDINKGSSVNGLASFNDGNSTYLYGIGSMGNLEYFVSKYDSDGNILWTKTGNGEAKNVSIDKTTGNIYVAGNGADFVTNDYFMDQYNPNGEKVWREQKRHTISGASQLYLNELKADNQGNYYIVGTATYNNVMLGYMAKYNALGNLIWEKTLGSPDGGTVSASGAGIDDQNNFFIAGDTMQSLYVGPTPGYFIAKYAP